MKKFNVFDPVLVRAGNKASWTADFYDHPSDNGHWCITNTLIKDENILPYNEETKHLHNTVGEFTKWEPKKGEPILVKDRDDAAWTFRIFIGIRGDKYACTLDPSVIDNTSGTTWDQAKPYTNPFTE